MSYLIFARKYRPQTFDEVVGQEHVVQTLQQAVESNRLAQSFLFTGSRGVGKTSMARILAKALNCQKGPTAKPCGKCMPCAEITSGNSLDTLEIDGASNRGIDEIRNLREQVRFKPVSGRFKIYIIDEVHMLTSEAFNALLKTLEEPPPHVKFIFATTEPAKVPITIVSRCQRFHFKPVPLRLIKEKLAEIAKAEKLKAGDDVLFLLARASEGSLRDAESLLDQLAGFSEGKLTSDAALEAFGLTSQESILSTVDHLSGRNTAALVEQIDSLVNEGKDLSRFSDDLAEALRHLLILNMVKDSRNLIDVSDDFYEELKKRRELFSREDLMFMLQVLSKSASDLKRSESPRLSLELALIQLSTRESLTSLSAILEEVKKLSGGKSIPDMAARTVGGRGLSQAAPSAAGGSPSAPGITGAEREKWVRQEKIQRTQALGTELASDHLDQTASSHIEPQTSVSPDPISNPGFSDKAEGGETMTAVLEDAGPSASSPPSEAGPLSFSAVEELWPAVVERVKAKKMSTGNYLAEAEPVDTEGNTIILGIEEELSFHKDALRRKEHSEIILGVCRQIFGPSVQIKFATTRPAIKDAKESEISTKVPPIVESAAEIFGGRLIRKQKKVSP